MTTPAGWSLVLDVPREATAIFCRAIEAFASATSEFETENPEIWRIEAYLPTEPDADTLTAALALAAELAGIPEPPVICRPLPGTDWVTENQRSFTPIAAGRYFIHPSHFEGRPPAGAIVIEIDAGPAFGTGAHGSTMGCLLALDRLARAGGRHRSMLDLGCGSGILALAMAATWRRRVLAVDIDPDAVATSRANARENAQTPMVRTLRSNGLFHREIGRAAPYDLITANILALPLIEMARELAWRLAPGGILLLSGFLESQERAVRAAYRGQGLAFIDRIVCDEWTTLVLERLSRRGRGTSLPE